MADSNLSDDVVTTQPTSKRSLLERLKPKKSNLQRKQTIASLKAELESDEEQTPSARSHNLRQHKKQMRKKKSSTRSDPVLSSLPEEDRRLAMATRTADGYRELEEYQKNQETSSGCIAMFLSLFTFGEEGEEEPIPPMSPQDINAETLAILTIFLRRQIEWAVRLRSCVDLAEKQYVEEISAELDMTFGRITKLKEMKDLQIMSQKYLEESQMMAMIRTAKTSFKKVEGDYKINEKLYMQHSAALKLAELHSMKQRETFADLAEAMEESKDVAMEDLRHAQREARLRQAQRNQMDCDSEGEYETSYARNLVEQIHTESLMKEAPNVPLNLPKSGSKPNSPEYQVPLHSHVTTSPKVLLNPPATAHTSSLSQEDIVIAMQARARGLSKKQSINSVAPKPVQPITPKPAWMKHGHAEDDDDEQEEDLQTAY